MCIGVPLGLLFNKHSLHAFCVSAQLCKPGVMNSLAQEIQGFSKARLKKQVTHVTTVTGRRLLERRSDGGGGGEVEQVEELMEGGGCGFVEDKSLDLQVGVVRPFLLLGNALRLLSLLKGKSCQFKITLLNPPKGNSLNNLFKMNRYETKDKQVRHKKRQTCDIGVIRCKSAKSGWQNYLQYTL